MTTLRFAAQRRAAAKPVKVPVPCRNTSGGPAPIEWTTVRMPLMSYSARSNPAMSTMGLSRVVVMACIPASSAPRSAGDAEDRPLRPRRREPEQRAPALLDDLVGLQDVLRAGMNVAVEALHHRVVQRGAACGAMGEG